MNAASVRLRPILDVVITTTAVRRLPFVSITALADNCAQLEQVRFSYCRGVNEAALLHLLGRCKRLARACCQKRWLKSRKRPADTFLRARLFNLITLRWCNLPQVMSPYKHLTSANSHTSILARHFLPVST